MAEEYNLENTTTPTGEEVGLIIPVARESWMYVSMASHSG